MLCASEITIGRTKSFLENDRVFKKPQSYKPLLVTIIIQSQAIVRGTSCCAPDGEDVMVVRAYEDLGMISGQSVGVCFLTGRVGSVRTFPIGTPRVT
jgi:hypothetical protein